MQLRLDALINAKQQKGPPVPHLKTPMAQLASKYDDKKLNNDLSLKIASVPSTIDGMSVRRGRADSLINSMVERRAST